MSIEVIASHDDSMSNPEPGLRRQVMSSSPSMMLVRHRMKKGWVGTRHSHPQEQMVYIVSSHLSSQHPGGAVEAKMGDSFLGGAMWSVRLSRSKTPKFWTSSHPGAKTTRRPRVRVLAG